MKQILDFLFTLVLVIASILGVGCSTESKTIVQGEPGSSCSVEETDSGAIIECTDGTSTPINNGRDGIDGRDGLNGRDAVVEIIDPCGPQTQYDEVILRMADGRLLAYFERGNLRFLTELGVGTYVTTDGSNCRFTVTKDGRIE